MSKNIEVLVVFEVLESCENANIEASEKYLKKEGFLKVEGEERAYQGFATTAVMNIRAFIFSVFAKAFEKAGYTKCKLICQIGENLLEAYMYEKDKVFFDELKL